MNLFGVKKSIFLFLGIALIFCGCQSTPVPSYTASDEDQIQSAFDKNSQSKEVYSGLYNSVTVSGTILRSEVIRARANKRAQLFLWNEETYKQELAKDLEKIATESQVFISFYTPEKKHDDLQKNQTLWKIFLDVNGKRYEGKAQKIKLLTTEVASLYPIHNRFSTPYILSFSLPVKEIDMAPARLTITGPVGSVSLDF